MMKTDGLQRLARFTRPVMRYKTPVLYRLAKWIVRASCSREAPGQELVTTFDGGKIHVNTSSSLEYHILFRGCHEPAIADLLKTILRKGYVCLDVGANIGPHTLLMADAVGPDGKVLAFEPHPAMARRLRSNIELNGYTNIMVLETALSDRDGESTFYSYDDDAFHKGGSSLLPDDEAKKAITVKTMTYAKAETLLGINTCHLIKIDVEGAESLVLDQLTPLIEQSEPYLIVEYRKQHWDKFDASIDRVLETLRGMHYRLSYIRKNNIKPVDGALPDSCELYCEPPTPPAVG